MAQKNFGPKNTFFLDGSFLMYAGGFTDFFPKGKTRHYDQAEVQKYMAHQLAERKRKQKQERMQKRKQEEEKQQRLKVRGNQVEVLHLKCCYTRKNCQLVANLSRSCSYCFSQIVNKFRTTCNKLDGNIRLVTRLS